MTATAARKIDWYGDAYWEVNCLHAIVAKLQRFLDGQDTLNPLPEDRDAIDFFIQLRLREIDRTLGNLLRSIVEEIDGVKCDGVGNAILLAQLAQPTDYRPALLPEHTYRMLTYICQHSGEHYRSLFGPEAHVTRAALINLTPAIRYLAEDIERYNDALKAEPEAEADETLAMGC